MPPKSLALWPLAAAAVITAGATPGAPAAGGFSAALDQALAHPAARAEARLVVECFDNGDFRTVEVLGRGIGLWNGSRQFAVPPQVVEAVLDAVRRSRFADLEEVYGGPAGRESRSPAEPPDAAAALRLLCGVTVTLGEISKRVVQLDKGERSPELAGLAAEIFDRVRELSRVGIAAAGLGDGLSRVASGELVPETLRLVFHRQPQRAGGGFLLRLDGLAATSRGFDPARGYGPTHRLMLAEDRLRELAGELARLEPERLPGNLYATEYSDLSLEVLGHKKAVQARRFAGMTPEAAGERQRDFDLLTDLAYNLHLRVLASGSPVEE